MRKILITIGQLNVGGAEMRLLHLCRELQLRNLGLDLSFYIVSGKPGTLDKKFRESGAELIYGKPGFRGMFELWNLCRRLKPDILHVNAETAAGFFAFSGLAANVPLRIAHYRSMEAESSALGSLKSLLYQVITNLFCNNLIGVSTGSRQNRLILRPWTTVYNGIKPPTDNEIVKTALPQQYSTTKTRIVVLGRIIESKNLLRSVEIFSALLRTTPDMELHLVGPQIDSSLAQAFTKAEDLGIRNRIVWHGSVPNPLDFVMHGSLVLSTSKLEGLPGSIIESLACGTPVVATDLPGALEIEERTSGLRCLSLEQSDNVWAGAIAEQLKFSRNEIRSAFAKSPFHSTQYVNNILKVWKIAEH